LMIWGDGSERRERREEEVGGGVIGVWGGAIVVMAEMCVCVFDEGERLKW
jgi:hypothetical protein